MLTQGVEEAAIAGHGQVKKNVNYIHIDSAYVISNLQNCILALFICK